MGIIRRTFMNTQFILVLALCICAHYVIYNICIRQKPSIDSEYKFAILSVTLNITRCKIDVFDLDALLNSEMRNYIFDTRHTLSYNKQFVTSILNSRVRIKIDEHLYSNFRRDL